MHKPADVLKLSVGRLQHPEAPPQGLAVVKDGHCLCIAIASCCRRWPVTQKALLLRFTYSSMCGVQVRLFYPETGSSSFGVIRAIVKDTSDMDSGNSSQTWLDSNGQVTP